jgi:hypothetical protein
MAQGSQAWWMSSPASRGTPIVSLSAAKERKKLSTDYTDSTDTRPEKFDELKVCALCW